MLKIALPEREETRSNKKKKNYLTLVTRNDYLTWINGYEKFSNKNKKILFDDLSILLSSGVNLVVALDLVLNSFNGKKEKTLIKSFIIDLTNGKSFFEVLQNSNKFSPYEFYSIKIGEETGKLPIILFELSKYISQRIDQRRKVVGAFSYPVVILVTAIIAVAFMLNFIVPMFEEIFKRFDKELPYLTISIIRLSENMTGHIFKLFTFTFLLISFNLLFRSNAKYLHYKSTLLLKIPIVGHLTKKVILARFCLTMELLLNAKTPLVESLNLAKSMVKHYAFKSVLIKMEDDIMSGDSLYHSMQQSNFFDIRMLALIKVAEEVNKLEDIFKQLKIQFNNDVEYQTNILSGIMEPLLIVFIGLFVGVILVSMYLPIFQISSSFM